MNIDEPLAVYTVKVYSYPSRAQLSEKGYDEFEDKIEPLIAEALEDVLASLPYGWKSELVVTVRRV